MKKNDSYDAPFFGLPNGQNPEPHAPMKYSSIAQPHPTNEAAKKVNHAEVMRQVLEAK